MSLSVGTCLGPYEVTAQIGAGGMGEVYRARDTKLHRSVALKILPQSFAQDAERLARFEREAKTLASLNHPNIAIIHGFEEADGIKALVMELVEGPTLADRIAQGPIPVDEALPIAKQIAEALEAAHEQGTVHRDLKPANVIVRPDGTVKVLDFGLAKAIADEAGTDLANSPTVTAMATSAGVLLGTAAYMSPEQARGKAVDKRTDIWAFGCVLFELLTGRRAFEGATIAETLAHVLERDPDWTAIPITTPLSVTRLLRRCLEKDHKRRLRDIGDARIEIDDVAGASAPLDQPGQTTTAHVSQSARSLFPWLAAVATLAAVILAVLYVRKALLEPALPRAVTRQTIAVPGPDFLDPWSPIAMSPDGLRLVYRTGGSSPRLSLQSLDRFEPAPIPGTEGGYFPFFSPGSDWVGFFTDSGKLKKVLVSGGEAQTICDLPSGSSGADWDVDGNIIFAAWGRGIWSVPAAGGAPKLIISPDNTKGEIGLAWPQILPHGKGLLFTVIGPRSVDFHLAAASPVTHQRRDLTGNGTYARYATNGQLVYASGAPPPGVDVVSGSLHASAFDVGRLEKTGPDVSVLENVWVSENSAAQFALSASGSLAYVLAGSTGPRTLVWVDRQGKETPLPAHARLYARPRLSPDGRRIAVMVADGDSTDIWIYDLASEVLSQLTFDGKSTVPVWVPRSNRLVWSSPRDGPFVLYTQVADGSGRPEKLFAPENRQFVMPTSGSPDGRNLVFWARNLPSGSEISVLPLDGDRKPHVLIRDPSLVGGGWVSPDGRWLAYVSSEGGHRELYVTSFPSGQGKWQISKDGGGEAVWSADGQLYWRVYRPQGDQIMATRPETTTSFAAAKSIPLFSAAGHLTGRPGIPEYDFDPVGQRFLMVKRSEMPPPTRLNVVLNWDEELKRLVPTK